MHRVSTTQPDRVKKDNRVTGTKGTTSPCVRIQPLKKFIYDKYFFVLFKKHLYLSPVFNIKSILKVFRKHLKVSFIMSKSLENMLQAMSGEMFGKSPNGTAMARLLQRERERERERARERERERERERAREREKNQLIQIKTL
jgi:hypothetical protein